MDKRSKTGIVHSGVDVKRWIERLPGVDEVRPGQCPFCGVASRPTGGRIGLHGHGLRERQQRGPLEPGGEPVIVVVRARRYRCVSCGAVSAVVPRGVLVGRHFSAAAIAFALGLFGLGGCSVVEVRRRASPWRRIGPAAATTWASLRRWVRTIRLGRLWPSIRPAPATWTARQVAERAATTLAAFAPPSVDDLELTDRAFFGAALAR